MGRPTSVEIRFSTFSAMGVKRRMRRSLVTNTMAICTPASRFTRSLLARDSSSLRPCSSSLTVLISSLVDCSSSLAVSSSSLVDCSSSLDDRISSLADCSSSLVASRSWMIDCRYSRLAASSCCRWVARRLVLRVLRRPGLAPCPGRALPAALACAVGRLLEQDQEVPVGVAPQRHHLEVGRPACDPLALTRSPSLRTGTPGPAGLVDGGAQAEQQPLARHLQQVEAGVARGQLQERARSAPGPARCAGRCRPARRAGRNAMSSKPRRLALHARRRRADGAPCGWSGAFAGAGSRAAANSSSTRGHRRARG